ncbi:uncharacterized protein ACB057_003500 [Neosynchiropus ocellatus]
MSDSGPSEPPVQPGSGLPPAEPQRRGRGRPRKLPQEPVGPPTPKRPRGRPKGSKNKCPKTALKVESREERRPRGRPRKWPQKVVQVETKTQPVASEEEAEGRSQFESSSSQVPPQEEEQ